MTTLRKKREFKKSSKKQNNKTSKKKIRKRSKKRLLARNKLGGAQQSSNQTKIIDIVSQRYESRTRNSDDIYEVLLEIGKSFVTEYNKNNSSKIELRHRGTRISSDDSVYLTIQSAYSVNGHKFEIFHLSDHPGESKSNCGAIHIKQLRTFEGHELGLDRCFKIISAPFTNCLSLSLVNSNNDQDIDYLKLKTLIENITKDKVIKLGLYTRLTEEQLNKLETPPDKKVEQKLTDSMEVNPPTSGQRPLHFLEKGEVGEITKNLFSAPANVNDKEEFPALPSKGTNQS